MMKQCAGFYVLLSGLCLALSFQVVLTSGQLQVTLILYEFLYYGRQPSRTSELNKPQTTEIASDELSTSPPEDTVSDITTEPPRPAGNSQSGPQKATGSEEQATKGNRNPPFPWQQETVCDTTSPPRPRYRFLLCFDQEEPMSDSNPCQLRRLETDALPVGTPFVGRDIVMFPVVLASHPTHLNPVTLAFDRWPGSIRLSIFVACCGVLGNYSGQCEEAFTHVITGVPAPSTWPSQPRNIYLEGQGRLMLRISLRCDESFYGPACETLCRIQAPQVEQAFCNVTTGRRQCMPGWEGSECQIDIDECRFHYCLNGAECVNSPPGSFTCKCPFGTGGRLCEARVPVCHQRPCLNGATCLDSAVGFLCFCLPGFTGYRCEVHVVLVPETGNRGSEINYPSQPHPVSFLAQDSSLAETVGGVGMPSPEQPANTWHTWYIAVIVLAVLVVTPIVVVGCLIIKGRKEYRIQGIRRSFYSFRFTARVLKRTGRRRHRDKDEDREKNDDRYPYIVHLHRTDNSGTENNSSGDNDDMYTHIVHLHRKTMEDGNSCNTSSNNTNDPDNTEDKYPHIVHLHRQVVGDQLQPLSVGLLDSQPNLGASSRTCENGRTAHDPRTLPLVEPLLSLLPSAQGGVQQTSVQDCQPDQARGFQPFTGDTGDSSNPGFPEYDVYDQIAENIFHKREALSGAGCLDGRLELVYAIGGTMTFEELSFAGSKHRKPGGAVPASYLATTATPTTWVKEVEAMQVSPSTARNLRRVDSAGYEVPQIRRPLAEGERSSGWDCDLQDHYHRVTLPDDVIYNDAGSESASLLELGVCTAVPPPREVR